MITICSYCQGCMCYSNDEDNDEQSSYGDTTIRCGVYGEAIKIIQDDDGLYYLGYSEGADEGGQHNFYSIGEAINFCPNCGRKLK